MASEAVLLQYTVLLTATNTSAAIPQGTGYATVIVGGAGGVILAGSLPDGEPLGSSGTFAQGTDANEFLINETLSYPSVTTNGAKGSLAGTITVAKVPGTSDFSGTLTWFKPQQSSGQYPAAIDTNLIVIGSLYAPPTNGSSLLPGFSTGTLDFTDEGNLTVSGNTHLSQTLTLTSSNTVVLTAPIESEYTGAINPFTGLFQGTFIYPGQSTPTAFTGVLFQDQTIGGGFFLGPNGSGSVSLTPTP